MVLVRQNKFNFQISKAELLALLLYVKGPKGNIAEEIVGKTRLMKFMFLLLKEANLEKYLSEESSFEAYKYGPFDIEIYDILDALEELDVIEVRSKMTIESLEIENENISDLISEIEETYDASTIFKLTEYGKEKTIEIYNEVPEDILRKIENIKIIWSKKPLIQLLHYVYTKYPDYAKMSEANIYD